MTRNDNVCCKYKKIGESYRHNTYECESESEKVDDDHAGVLGVFIEVKLLAIEENNCFTEEEVEISNNKTLHEDITKDIGKVEAITSTYASVKEGHMEVY